MLNDLIAARTKSAHEAAKGAGSYGELAQEGAGLVHAQGLDKAMALWLSKGKEGRALAKAVAGWWRQAPATGVLWRPTGESPRDFLDALLALPPLGLEMLADEAEAFLTEMKYALAAGGGGKTALPVAPGLPVAWL
jgi:hypothetical protein